jgi:hypothetical protein
MDLKWLPGVLLAASAILIGGYFFINHMVKKEYLQGVLVIIYAGLIVVLGVIALNQLIN